MTDAVGALRGDTAAALLSDDFLEQFVARLHAARKSDKRKGRGAGAGATSAVAADELVEGGGDEQPPLAQQPPPQSQRRRPARDAGSGADAPAAAPAPAPADVDAQLRQAASALDEAKRARRSRRPRCVLRARAVRRRDRARAAHGGALAGRGVALLKLGRADEAVRALDAAIAADPDGTRFGIDLHETWTFKAERAQNLGRDVDAPTRSTTPRRSRARWPMTRGGR